MSSFCHGFFFRRLRATAGAAALAAGLAVLPLTGCVTLGDGAAKPSAQGQGAQAQGGNYASLMRIAAQAQSQGDLNTASTLFGRAHETAPDKVEPLLGLANALTDLGRPREALDAWRSALTREPANPDALRGYGRALIAMDQPQEAARQYASLLSRDPKDVRALTGIGVAKDMMGDHAGAQAQYSAALALAPNDRNTRNNLGFSLLLSGKAAEAIAILEPLARDPAATAQQRQNLALAYGLAGRDDEAARTARLDLDETAVQQNLAYYREARAGGRTVDIPR
ncbi:tetratricopeptide repeat protein [Azospirillum sp. sgz302134]